MDEEKKRGVGGVTLYGKGLGQAPTQTTGDVTKRHEISASEGAIWPGPSKMGASRITCNVLSPGTGWHSLKSR